MKRFLIFLTIFLLLAVFALQYFSWSNKNEEKLITIEIKKPDEFLKTTQVVDLQGNTVDLTNYLGKPIVINFWATWCLPCIAEMGSFETVRQEKLDSVNFILISDEPIEKIKKFSSEKGYQLIYLKSNKTLKELQIDKIPQTYFFNKYGVLTQKYNNSIYSKIIREELQKMKEKYLL